MLPGPGPYTRHRKAPPFWGQCLTRPPNCIGVPDVMAIEKQTTQEHLNQMPGVVAGAGTTDR